MAARLTKPVAVAWAKNVPDAQEDHADQNGGQIMRQQQRKASDSDCKPSPRVARVPQRWTAWPASGVVKIDGRNTKYTKPSCMGLRDNGGRVSTKLT